MKYAFVLEPSEHAELSASSAERWGTCTGSPALIKGLPNHSTSYAAVGTAAHYIGAAALRREKQLSFWRGKMAKVEGHDIRLDDEMIEAVQEYLDDIALYRLPGDHEFIEHSFTPAMKKLHPKFGGSADYVNFRPSTRRLRVEDYKHGAGVPVDVDDNKQLKYYALGTLLSFPQFSCDEVEIRIAQPRCEHEAGRFRSYVLPAVELIDFAADLVEKAKETEDFTLSKLVPSKKACRFCPAAGANKCPALEKVTHALTVKDFEVVTFDPERYSPVQIAEFLEKAPLVEQRISAMREFAYQESLKGKKFPGWKIVEKKKTRKVTDEEALKESVKGQPDVYTEPELKSPAQLEKALGIKKYRELVEPYVEKSSSGYTLAPESDPRAPAQVALISDFSVVDPQSES
jgi:hypothetical protein